MVCRTKKVSYADKIFVTNTHSAVAHVTSPVEIKTKMKKEKSNTPYVHERNQVMRHNIYVDIITHFEKEYEILCKYYDIDQDSDIYDDLESISEAITEAVYQQQSDKNAKQY